ncbi:flagellar basal body protein [Desulforamulus profundi]|uniref:flagellar basal body protein n=1 Tax=Desulforamulus profundi TaxID=1383067 RepID=UPI001EE5B74B|nr:flagellar basal body protein [Desulforamulus profundi]
MIIKTLASGASGMRAHQVKLDTIGNNIANVNTTGFKRSRANFADIVRQALGDEGVPTTDDPGLREVPG